MTKVKAFSSTGSSSKDGEMNDYGVIFFKDGSVSHLSREIDIRVVAEVKEIVSAPRSEQTITPKKKNNK